MFEDLLLRLGIMYALMLTGMIVRWLVKRTDVLMKVFANLLINLLVPVIIFSSTIQFSITLVDPDLILLSVSVFIFSSVLAYLFLRVFRLKGAAAGPFVLNSINANEVYLPLPIVYALYGIVGLAYSTLFLLVFNLATAFYFIPLYSYYSSVRREKRIFLRNVLLFPPFLASVVGLIALSVGVKLPQLIVQPASYLGQLTTYLALLFVGLSIKPESEDWFSRPVLGVAAIRLLIVPLITFGLLKFFHFKVPWGGVLIIHSGMPAAVNNIIFTDYFNLDRRLTAKIVAETTVFTLFTLPLLLFLGDSQ